MSTFHLRSDNGPHLNHPIANDQLGPCADRSETSLALVPLISRCTEILTYPMRYARPRCPEALSVAHFYLRYVDKRPMLLHSDRVLDCLADLCAYGGFKTRTWP